MKPPHKLFFSSLKQVEKRLKLDDGNLAPPPPPPALPQTSESTESLCGSSPIYIYNQTTNASSTVQDNSIEQPPQEFLSDKDTDDFPSKPHNELKDSKKKLCETSSSSSSSVDDIESMIQVLRVSESDNDEEEAEMGEDEFYEKIVKVKGPKSKKEVERLNGWIKYLLRSKEEPLRLAHLVLAKAAFVSVGSGGGDDGLEFPSTIDEFLQNDPPSDGWV